jgi:hypothetical protein
MAGTAFKDAKVLELAKSFDAVLVNCETNADLVEKYAVQTQPTVVYASSDGTALTTNIDAASAEEVVAEMNGALEKVKNPPPAEK